MKGALAHCYICGRGRAIVDQPCPSCGKSYGWTRRKAEAELGRWIRHLRIANGLSTARAAALFRWRRR